MKFSLILTALSLLTAVGGCDIFKPHQLPGDRADEQLYSPAELNIIGLTEIITAADESKRKNIDVYLDLRDAFDSPLKSPATFRFELYEYVPRTAQRRGRRIYAWPDMDLLDSVENDAHWRNYLQAYFFDLPIDFALPVGKSFILYVTAITEHGKRMTTSYDLKNL